MEWSRSSGVGPVVLEVVPYIGAVAEEPVVPERAGLPGDVPQLGPALQNGGAGAHRGGPGLHALVLGHDAGAQAVPGVADDDRAAPPPAVEHLGDRLPAAQ